jgi:hypothetical protein
VFGASGFELSTVLPSLTSAIVSLFVVLVFLFCELSFTNVALLFLTKVSFIVFAYIFVE